MLAATGARRLLLTATAAGLGLVRLRRRQDSVQGIAFLPGHILDNRTIPDIFDQPLQQLTSKAGSGHFSTAEKDGGLDLVTFLEEAKRMILLGLVVVVVHVDTKLYFLDGDDFLVLFGFAFPLFLLVEVLAEVHDAANGRLRRRRNLNQVHVAFPGDFERVLRGHNPELIAFIIDYADFAYANALVSANKSLVDTILRNKCKTFEIIAC